MTKKNSPYNLKKEEFKQEVQIILHLIKRMSLDKEPFGNPHRIQTKSLITLKTDKFLLDKLLLPVNMMYLIMSQTNLNNKTEKAILLWEMDFLN